MNDQPKLIIQDLRHLGGPLNIAAEIVDPDDGSVETVPVFTHCPARLSCDAIDRKALAGRIIDLINSQTTEKDATS